MPSMEIIEAAADGDGCDLHKSKAGMCFATLFFCCY